MTVGLTPTPQLGTLGRKQEAHPHPDLQPSSVSLLTKKGGVAPEKIPLALPQRKVWKPGVTCSREPGWNSIKNSPCKGRAGLTNPTWLPLSTRPFWNPEDSTIPHSSLWPCPSLQCQLGLQPRVSCGQAGQDSSQRSARSEQKSQPAPNLFSCPRPL